MMVFQFIGIQIFSAMYLLLILVVYLSKKRYTSVENSIFRTLLLFTIFELGIDIGINYSIKYAELVPIINSILCRISLFGYQLWTALLVLYVVLLGNNKGYKSLKELYKNNLKLKIGTIIVLLLGLVVFVLPLDYLYDETYRISYIVGKCTMYTYAITLIYLVIVLGTVLLNKNKVSLMKRLPIFVFIVTASIFLPIQRFNSDVPVLIIPLMSYAVMIMYFTLENPDLKMINELEQLKKEADESNRLKSEIFNNISDDIRTPMNAIVSFSETILTEDLPLKAKKDAEQINTASRLLLEMIDNTLDISKVESGLVKINNNKYDLRVLIENIQNIILNSINTEKVNLVIDVDKSLPCNLYGDEEKVFRILSNLLTNAVKYTEVGKICLIIKGTVGQNKVLLNIKISDTGIGIKKEDFDKIFLKFGRLNNKMTRNVEGTGLGLSISKMLIDLLGGTITFDSVYGGGTSFHIKLTQLIDNSEIDNNNNNLSNDHIKKDFNNLSYNILLVDDNKLDISVMQRMLEMSNLNITNALSSDECINLIKTGKYYDIIFFEESLFYLNNINTIKVIRELKNSNKTKIIALTSNTITKSKKKFLQEGFDDIITKPIKLNELNKILSRYLGKE